MAYKLSERLNQDQLHRNQPVKGGVNYDKVVCVFVVFAVINFITAWVFSGESHKISTNFIKPINPGIADSQAEGGATIASLGPITIPKNGHNEVYSVSVTSSVLLDKWAFVEGEVVDRNQDYLFSFGKEFWYETGYDDEERWSESENHYRMKMIFPEPGEYYLNVKVQGNYIPDAIQVEISKHHGSAIPHLLFGVICLFVVIWNEAKHHTIARFFYKIHQLSI